MFFRIQHRRNLLISIGIWLAAAVSALGIDYSVPYVRDGLPYAGYGGFGAIVGELEVRDITSQYYNGIDGFSGHTQSLIAPPDGDPLRSFIGFQDVKDFTSLNDPTDKNFHGTFVAGIMASEAELITSSGTTSMMGVAPWARYYGAVFDGAGSSSALLSLNNSLAYLTSTAGASVINCSWGSEETDAANLNGSSYATSLLLDEYAGYSGKSGGTTGKYLDKLIVVSAGNSGTTSGLLGAPADAYNVLTVGALDVVNPNTNGLLDPTRSPTAKVAAYSSWRPLANGRAGVDVVAPGTDIWSTLYINYSGTNGLIAGTADGTSFAAPHVTGVAAVLYGAASGAGLLQTGSDSYAMVTYSGMQTAKGTALSTDHKLIKAIIINSADKIAGLDENGNAQSTWQPGKVVMTNGVPNAVVPLNYAVGAGSVNAYKAVQQYDEQGNNFWDLGDMRVTGGDTYYTFGVGKFVPNSADQVFLTGLTATLVWDRHVDYSVDPTGTTYGEVTKDLLSNLDLILQREVSPGVWENVYMSAGDNSNVEHIYYSPVITGTQVVNYRLEVHATSLAEPDTGETYAIVVSYETSAVPEPATWVLIIVAAAGWKLRQLRWKTKLPPERRA